MPKCEVYKEQKTNTALWHNEVLEGERPGGRRPVGGGARTATFQDRWTAGAALPGSQVARADPLNG